MTKTTGYIRLGPHMTDIILVKQEIDYELTGEQVTPSPVNQKDVRSVGPTQACQHSRSQWISSARTCSTRCLAGRASN